MLLKVYKIEMFIGTISHLGHTSPIQTSLAKGEAGWKRILELVN